MIKRFWDGSRFIPLQGNQCLTPVKDQMSLLCFIPIILGKRLPNEITSAIIRTLSTEGKYLSQYGIASESMDSPDFECHSGWDCGLIIAQNQMMIVSGLEASGYPDLAKTIAQRYCTSIRKNGFYNNFNPITGRGLDHRCSTGTALIYWTSWVSAVYLILQKYYE